MKSILVSLAVLTAATTTALARENDPRWIYDDYSPNQTVIVKKAMTSEALSVPAQTVMDADAYLNGNQLR
jgi:hypothetical protein